MATKNKNITIKNIFCCLCDNELPETEFYSSSSMFFPKKMLICKGCLERLYNLLFNEYKNKGSINPEKDAIFKICQKYDVYYSDKVLNTAFKDIKSKSNMSLVNAYFKATKLFQHSKKTFENTITELDIKFIKENESLKTNISNETKQFFGTGFSTDDYRFLQEQYEDWTARHECETKVQEEVFKQICFAQLNILKAQRAGEDTKDVVATFQKLLDTAKLQPKQNYNETTSNTQSFGQLIDKWENTRPIPEVCEELKDVDKMIVYTDVFYRGHLSKMMGLKNGLSNLYNKYMKKYTVEKPEYKDDESSEAIFDAVFGSVDIE